MALDAFDVGGRVAVITGGGTGIGRATALLFAEAGAPVVLASRKVGNLDRVAAEVRERGGHALVVPTDVRDPEQCRALVERTIAEHGRIDVLVNNAGGSHSYPLESWTVDAWENMLALNLRSVFLLSQAAAAHMVERGSGAIVNVSSGASQLGLPYVAPYGAAKAGVNNLTKTLAGALTPKGVRVNCVAVGAVASEGFVREMERIGRDPDEVGGMSNAVGRAGRPEEIAYPILFLASDAASFLSGETIYVGGGPHVPAML
ncbi:MAG TPA: SDR family oxidoreductase [Acidimicrobiia bacterium]|nr:SDR family oxidoreductase [Acidimicrobiia bacterium]